MSLTSCVMLSSPMTSPFSAGIASLHVAFLPVRFHLSPHFLWDPSHLQTASFCGLLPRGESPPPETIKGLGESSAQSAEQQPRRGPAEGEWRSKCPAGSGEGLQWIYVWLEGMLFTSEGLPHGNIGTVRWYTVLLFPLLHNDICYTKWLHGREKCYLNGKYFLMQCSYSAQQRAALSKERQEPLMPGNSITLRKILSRLECRIAVMCTNVVSNNTHCMNRRVVRRRVRYSFFLSSQQQHFSGCCERV